MRSPLAAAAMPRSRPSPSPCFPSGKYAFLCFVPDPATESQPPTGELTVVLDWFEELRRLMNGQR